MPTDEQLLALDLRVGTIVAASVLRGTRKASFALTLELGPLGRRTSAAEIADLYDPGDLVGLQVVALVNLPPRRVASIDVDAIVLTVDDGRGERVLLIPERPLPDGGRVQP